MPSHTSLPPTSQSLVIEQLSAASLSAFQQGQSLPADGARHLLLALLQQSATRQEQGYKS